MQKSSKHNKKFLLSFLSCMAVVNHCNAMQKAINPVLLSPTDSSFYQPLQREFEDLKSNSPTFGESQDKVCLSKAENIERAPKLYAFLQHLVETLIQKTHLTMPTIYIYLGEDVTSYNASMQKVVLVSRLTTTTETGSVTTEIVNNEYNLTVGKELINLFFWDAQNQACLIGVIAHEIGHAINDHTTQSKENEYTADRTAIKMLEDPQTLPKAIDMLTLAGHLYNNLAAIASDALKEHVHFLIRVMTSSLIQEFPDLGQLGNSSSHSSFATSVNAALYPILNPEATKGQSIGAAQIVINAYNNLRQACTDPAKLLGQDQAIIAAQGKLLDALTSQLFSPISHPDPRSRRRQMKASIAAVRTAEDVTSTAEEVTVFG